MVVLRRTRVLAVARNVHARRLHDIQRVRQDTRKAGEEGGASTVSGAARGLFTWSVGLEGDALMYGSAALECGDGLWPVGSGITSPGGGGGVLLMCTCDGGGGLSTFDATPPTPPPRPPPAAATDADDGDGDANADGAADGSCMCCGERCGTASIGDGELYAPGAPATAPPPPPPPPAAAAVSRCPPAATTAMDECWS